MTLKFSDLNPLGRAIIIAVAVLTFGVAAVSFATSYGALYAYVRDTGLYSERLTRLWPLLLDGAFIVAQLAAILAGILRGSRGWPILTMLLTGALTVWFNLQHAGSDPGRRLAAALPPVLMMLAFEIDVQIVRWVMRALGKPMGPITPPPPTGMLAAPVPGAVWRPDGHPFGAVPQVGPYPPWSADVYGQMPSPPSSESAQNGQHGPAGAGANGGAEPAEALKRQRIEAYLAGLSAEQLNRVTAREVTAALSDQGLDVSERYVARILDLWTAERRGSAVRKKGRR